jgi:hypothetical protein
VAFIVANTASEELAIPQRWFKGRCFPQFQRFGRLDVIVAVEE